MRVGNFSIEKGDQKAELAILPFPGGVGGELENVNRWRGEIGLEPVSEASDTSETVRIGSEPAKLFDLQGPKLSTLGAMIQRDGTTWVFKMRGDKELVAENKGTLVEFLKTVQFAETRRKAAPAYVQAEEDDHEDHTGHDHGPKWQVPSNWKEGGQKPMVVKNWDVAGENTTANIAISSFPGQVGGVVANVNRWRGQIGLRPMSEAEVRNAVQVLETSDGHSQALVFDFEGTDPKTSKPTRLVAAIVPHGDETWFYKMTGDIPLVEREKAAFLKLVQTANYH
ncbi:MAG: hypothetical protein ACK4UN_00570, partial [Limisphaerales bacterium]